MEILYQVPGDPEPNARIETVIKAVLVLDGAKLCSIGFLPRQVAARPEEPACLHNKFAQIIELYDLTLVGRMRHNKLNRCNGMAYNVPAIE
jgi:hypothetical protein